MPHIPGGVNGLRLVEFDSEERRETRAANASGSAALLYIKNRVSYRLSRVFGVSDSLTQ